MKRKTDSEAEAVHANGNGNGNGNGEPDAKKRALTVASRFRDGLLNRDVLEEYKNAYAGSQP